MTKKASKDMKSLRDSLAASLKQAVPSAGNAVAAEITPRFEPSASTKVDLPPSTSIPEEELKRTTVSMKAAEQRRADEILDVLQKCRRHRGGLTEAISIALRICPLDPDQVGRAWDESRAADRRTHRKAKT